MSNFIINSTKNINIGNIDTYVNISNASIDNLYSTTPDTIINNNRVATTAYVNKALNSLNINQDTIQTINLNASTVNSNIGNFNKLYSITPIDNNNNSEVATIGYVNNILSSLSVINVPIINASTGNFDVIRAKTQDFGTTDDRVATTEFVQRAIAETGGGGGGGGINNGENYINGDSIITSTTIKSNTIIATNNISTPSLYSNNISTPNLSADYIKTRLLEADSISLAEFSISNLTCENFFCRSNSSFKNINSSTAFIDDINASIIRVITPIESSADNKVATTLFVNRAIQNTTLFNVSVETVKTNMLRSDTIQPNTNNAIRIEGKVDITQTLSLTNLSTYKFSIGNNLGTTGQSVVCTPTGIDWGYPVGGFNNTATSDLNMSFNNINNVKELNLSNQLASSRHRLYTTSGDGPNMLDRNYSIESDVLILNSRKINISGGNINMDVGTGYVNINGDLTFNNVVPTNGTFLSYNNSQVAWSQVPWQGTATSNLSMGDTLSINTRTINSNNSGIINVNASVSVNITSPTIALTSSDTIIIGNSTTKRFYTNSSSMDITATNYINFSAKNQITLLNQNQNGMLLLNDNLLFSSNQTSFLAQNNVQFISDTVNFMPSTSNSSINLMANQINMSASSIRFVAPIQNYFMSYNASQGTNISSALGYIVPKYGFPSLSLSSSPTVIETLSISAFGVWMFNWSCIINVPSLPTTCYVSNLGTTLLYTRSGFTKIDTNTYEASGCETVVLPPSVCPLYLIYSSSILLAAFNYKATRIA